MNSRKYLLFIMAGCIIVFFTALEVWAIDSESTRQTLKKIEGVMVITEELQPNITKYIKKNIPSKEALRADIELMMRRSGIKVLMYDEWLKSPGRPVLYVNINTHEHEKYWFAYDIRIELQQIVFLESNPKNRALASTWSLNVTGTSNVGALSDIRDNALFLVVKFINAYKSVNSK